MTDRTPAVTVELRAANDDAELAGISHIVSVLEGFDAVTQERMLTYLCDRFPRVRLALGEQAPKQEG